MTRDICEVLRAQASGDHPRPVYYPRPHPLLQPPDYTTEPPPAYYPVGLTFDGTIGPVDIRPSGRLDLLDAVATTRACPGQSVDPELPDTDTGSTKFTMELHIIYKKAGRKVTGTTTKAPLTLSSALDYDGFLDAIARAAEVRKSQIDCENLQWLPKRPANSKPTAVSNNESFELMLKEICNKKESDRWVVIRMGKPFVSDAVRSLSPSAFMVF